MRGWEWPRSGSASHQRFPSSQALTQEPATPPSSTNSFSLGPAAQVGRSRTAGSPLAAQVMAVRSFAIALRSTRCDPILIYSQHIVPDSEGAGRRRGAPGGFVEFGPRDTQLEAIYLSDGTANPPRGARGGMNGSPARQFRRGPDGTLTKELDAIGHVQLQTGETILSYTTGGGGRNRDPEGTRARSHRRARGMVRRDAPNRSTAW